MAHDRLGPGREFDLIRRFLERDGLARPDVRVGPGDDAAVVVADGVVLSTDLSIEGIHFRREWVPSFDIGWRATAAAISDLAAMAARPIGVLASLAVAEQDADEVAVQVMAGVEEAVARVGGVLLGGDLTRSPGPLLLDITAVGASSDPVLRSGATAGDEVWVTGELGAAAACVALLRRGDAVESAQLEPFARPRPRVREALWLHERGVPRAMLDLSDGLAGDASHIAAASGVAVVLDRAAVPIHALARGAGGTGAAAFDLAVSGGEDYELCLTAAPGAGTAVAAAFQEEFGLRLTRVGTVEPGEGVWWRDGDRRERAVRGGYQHFGGES